MKTFLRNIGVVLLGLVLGSVANMGLIELGGVVIPPPSGANVKTMEGLKAAMPLFGPQHFLFPFLAHAIGTLVGAAIATALWSERRMIGALIVGAVFFNGGVAAVLMLPAPMWFEAVDLVFAYFPMALLGYWLVAARRK